MKPYVVLHKEVGQTPLQVIEAYKLAHPDLSTLPMAYAGRLDPMASGKLLVLIGEECKVQEKYHGLDKEYIFEVLFGVSSDTADVLGLLKTCEVSPVTAAFLRTIAKRLEGHIELPYPHFSSKTVGGKPLHIWTLEGKISQINIPTKHSVIHSLKLVDLKQVHAQEVYVTATEKIETIAKVTQESKKLGNDFRRADVRIAWQKFIDERDQEELFYIAKFVCVASSGTYMRTLAELIANEVHTCGLAYSIERTKIGVYKKLFNMIGMWTKQYR